MTEVCKVCKGEYTMVNHAHVRTHDMTMDEYKSYDDIVPIEPDNDIEPIWDSLDTTSLRYKTRQKLLMQNKLKLKSTNNVVRKRLCSICQNKINEPVAYVILRTRLEKQAMKLENEQNAVHVNCAIAIATVNDKLASVYIASIPFST